jgi:hypothetical protein
MRWASRAVGGHLARHRRLKWRQSHFAAADAMSFFARAPYKSEVSTFLDELKARNPRIEADQRAGRALLWDRVLDRKTLEDWNMARVPQQPYVYQNKT